MITAGMQIVDVVMKTEQTVRRLSSMWCRVVASFEMRMWGGTFSFHL